MIPVAPSPSCEPERLLRLKSYDILDTPPSEAFDKITRIIVDTLNVPTGIVSFIDEDRQWYKSKIGIDLNEVPRDFSFCQFALLKDDIMLVPDAKEDPLFANHPAVLNEPYIRFYVSAPIMTEDRLPLGTICAFDSKPRTMTDHEKKRFLDLAGIVMDQLDLIYAKSESERANKTKDKFLSIIAHDLKSPFNSLLGMTEMMSEMADQISPKELAGLATGVHQSGRKLYDLLQDLLEWANYQKEGETVTPINFQLDDLINDVLPTITPVAEGKDLNVKLAPSQLEAFADVEMIKTVIRNLTTNAIKFTPEGGSIVISSKQKDEQVIVSVTDTGIGIETKLRDKLFLLDYKTTTRGTNGEVGTGMGLPLCKEIIEKNGGKIWVDSATGQGSSFSFSLPIKRGAIG